MALCAKAFAFASCMSCNLSFLKHFGCNQAKGLGKTRCLPLATGGSAQIRGFATGVGSKADRAPQPLGGRHRGRTTRRQLTDTPGERGSDFVARVGRACGERVSSASPFFLHFNDLRDTQRASVAGKTG